MSNISDTRLLTLDQNNTAAWTFVPIWTTCVTVGMFLSHGSALLVFAANRELWTPFNIYLINLSVAGLLMAVCENPGDIISFVYPTWPFGFGYCAFYLYSMWVIVTAYTGAHVLISVDRLWAMWKPVSYRLKRRRTSVVACIVMWICAHLITVPGISLELVRKSGDNATLDCALNPQGQYVIFSVSQMIGINLPLVLIVVVYVLVGYKHFQRHKVVRPSQRVSNMETARDNDKSTVNQGSRHEAQNAPTRQSDRHLDRGFRYLTLMTLSLVVFTGPSDIVVTVGLFIPIEDPRYFSVTYCMVIIPPLTDLLWFLACLPKFRKAYLETFRVV